MKKISYLIVNKDASLKAISKEVFKLNVIIGNKRVQTLEQDFSSLVQKCIKNEGRLQQSMADFYSPSEIGTSYTDWANTPSSQSLDGEGNLRDECALAWPIAYHEYTSQEFALVIDKITKLNLKDIVFTYKNVLLTLPINMNGNTDSRISECLKS